MLILKCYAESKFRERYSSFSTLVPHKSVNKKFEQSATCVKSVKQLRHKINENNCCSSFCYAISIHNPWLVAENILIRLHTYQLNAGTSYNFVYEFRCLLKSFLLCDFPYHHLTSTSKPHLTLSSLDERSFSRAIIESSSPTNLNNYLDSDLQQRQPKAHTINNYQRSSKQVHNRLAHPIN